MNSELIQYQRFAVNTARAAGHLLLKSQDRAHQIEWKLRTNFKTETDDASDQLIRDEIVSNFPDHNIFSEESAYRDRSSPFTWVVDSLDGTIPWAYGINDHFSISIALCRGKKPIVGVIYAPRRDELYVASEGNGTTLNNTPVSPLQETDINRVLMGIDFGKTDRTSGLPYLAKLLAPDGITCNFSHGCATVPLALVASGKMHAYLATSLAPEDMAAAVIINREAGNKVTNLDFEEWTLGNPSILVANPRLHQNLQQFLETH